MSSIELETINGDPAALAFDRALAEMRRGRVVQVSSDGSGLLVAAVETLSAPLFRRLAAAGRAVLLVTAERALAAGLARSSSGPVAIELPREIEVEHLRLLAGVAPSDATPALALTAEPACSFAALAAGGFQLAKACRLVPALVGVRVDAAAARGVIAITTEEIARHAAIAQRSLKLVSRARVPLADAVDSEIALFRDEYGSAEHLAVLIGKLEAGGVVPVRLHSACLTGDLLGSLRCDCGEQLRTAVARIAALGGGVLLYLDQEGRGIGLPNKLRAYVLQDEGLDTVDADRHLGFLADERSYDVAAALLRQLGIERIRLLTNNPQKIDGLREHGIEVVGRLPLIATANSHNERYLRAKLERAGHLAEESGS
jgi:GTP cyclohydrolase II